MHKRTVAFFMPSLAKFTGIEAKDIRDYWGLACPLIQRGLGEGENIQDVFKRLQLGDNQLWIAYKGHVLLAACVTEIVTLGDRKVCNILSVGGTALHEWANYISTLEAWAKSKNCSSMRFPIIRKGWARVLKKYQTTHITLEKGL
jgi:hypothetical protein